MMERDHLIVRCTHHTHTYTHICIHTHIHTYTCTRTRIHTHTHRHKHLHTHTQIHTQTHTHTHTHIHTHTYTHSHIHTCTHAHTGAVLPLDQSRLPRSCQGSAGDGARRPHIPAHLHSNGSVGVGKTHLCRSASLECC